jgi:DNA-binding FrmR family transcriptional regulator
MNSEREATIKRLARIEGQVRGVARMIEEDAGNQVGARQG